MNPDSARRESGFVFYAVPIATLNLAIRIVEYTVLTKRRYPWQNKNVACTEAG